MKNNRIEIISAIIILLILIGTPLAISYNSPWKNHSKKRIINLTAVAAQGIWTEDKVDGTNYWNTNFKRANIILTKGEEVILRFTSVDVTHTFYAPEVGLGPFVVEAGHIYNIPYTPTETGKFTYYCTSFCGKCHLYMRGNLVILSKEDYNNQELVRNLTKDTIRPDCCITDPTLDNPSLSFIQHGQSLFRDKGCFRCHGEGGRGGVYNPNYANRFVPTLNTLANKLKISDKEEADSLIKLLDKGADMEKLNDSPPFASYNRFYAQYCSITQKILDGAPVVQKMDTLSYIPPLLMPSWQYHLSKRDINSIISYLISIYDWEND
jgi:hypothetical protein